MRFKNRKIFMYIDKINLVCWSRNANELIGKQSDW